MLINHPRVNLRPVEAADNGNHLIARGRWVNLYNPASGLMRRCIRPRYGNRVTDETERDLIEPLLRQISGQQSLDKLLLLVGPSSVYSSNRKLHCFNREALNHLGSSSITHDELELIQKNQMLLKYDIVYTEERLSLRALATSVDLISKLKQEQCLAPRSNVEVIQAPPISSLRQPKIPVRMRVSDLRRLQKKQKKDDAIVVGRPIWKL